MAEILAPDYEITQEQAEISPSALAILNQSEHAAMVASANLPANRRKLKDFDDKLMQYATHSQPVALSMFYTLPRAGKQIVGASIRFAEVVVPCWKNCAVASRVLGDANDTVTAQGIFIDYEANIRNSVEAPRRITDKDGRRYNADMIVTTMNAAMSIARRNAVLKGGVPQALWAGAYEAAKLTAVGSAVSHAQRVANAMEYLMKLGVTEIQALNAVECPSVKDLEIEHLVTLKVLCEEIKRGEKTIEEVFGSPQDKEIDALLTQLGKNASQSRMLRESYKGRPKELLDFLQGQLKPKSTQSTEDWVAQKSTPAFNEKQATAGASVAEQGASTESVGTASAQSTPATQGEPKRGRGRPSREEMARRKAAEEAVTTAVSQVEAQPIKSPEQPVEEEPEGDREDSVQQEGGGTFDF